MSSPSTYRSEELLTIAMSGSENMVNAAEEREQERPHTFLSLAPTVSASYPAKPATAKSPVLKAKATPGSEAVAGLAEISVVEKSRRSSSMSSNGSVGQRRRFLRLCPVHHGQHQGEEGDWSEEVVVE